MEEIPYHQNSDDFIFDNELLAQMTYANFAIGEITCPTKYFPEASSINFKRSVKYGLGVIRVSFAFRLQKLGLWEFRVFQNLQRK